MFNFALKNIFFYRSRSITTFFLTFFSSLLLIVYVAMMDGSHESMLENALKVYTGAIEIYQINYRELGGNEYLIKQVNSIEKKLSAIKEIEHFSSRYETYGLLSSKANSSASMVAGIDPEKEKNMSQLEIALKEGQFLTKNSANCLYAGSGLVKKLKVKIGDVVSFIGVASDNSFAADLFKLCGIFKTGSAPFDGSSSFVSRKYFDQLMYSQNKASYINIKPYDLTQVDMINSQILKIIDDDKESLTWKTLMKPMVQAMEVDSVFGYISISLFYVVIFFVIMIFGFINVSSRIKEFGTLRCIGLSRANIRLLLFYEILILSSLAIFFAAPIGTYISYFFSINPITIEGMSEMYQDYGIVSDELPFSFNLLTVLWNITLVYVLNFLSIIYPISYINSFTALEAAHHV
jgi:ABC-type lipoprotein release transport system permease subunit